MDRMYFFDRNKRKLRIYLARVFLHHVEKKMNFQLQFKVENENA